MTASAPAAVTRTLADFAASLTLADVPRPVRTKVRLHVLDQLGCQLIGSQVGAAQLVGDYVARFSATPMASVVGREFSTSPELAALANGTSGTAWENDDYHPAALIHPSAIVVSAAIAAGEHDDSSGDEMLLAMVLGFEVACRLGAGAQPGMNYGRSVHPTSALGPFAAAIAAGRLMRLEGPGLVHALGIAGSHSSGTLEYSLSGGTVKRMHAGLAAQAGVRAAALARAGMTGPATIIEGPRGVLQALGNDPDFDRIVRGLGDQWTLLDTAVKPYFCNGLLQGPVHSIVGFRSAGIPYAEIRHVSLGVNRMAYSICGDVGPEPADMVTAQFSPQLISAIAMRDGFVGIEQLRTLESRHFRDPELLALASKVKIEIDPMADAAFPDRFVSTTSVTLNDGRTFTDTCDAPGTSQNPINDDVIVRKFRDSASGHLAESVIENLVRQTTGPEELFDPASYGQMLSVAVHKQGVQA